MKIIVMRTSDAFTVSNGIKTKTFQKNTREWTIVFEITEGKIFPITKGEFSPSMYVSDTEPDFSTFNSLLK